jgi:hypothetical protein
MNFSCYPIRVGNTTKSSDDQYSFHQIRLLPAHLCCTGAPMFRTPSALAGATTQASLGMIVRQNSTPTDCPRQS